MKTSGKLLHNLTSLFHKSATGHKRKNTRKSRMLQMETLETRQLLTVPAFPGNDPTASVTIFLDFDGADFSGQNVRVQGNQVLGALSAVPGFNLDNIAGPDSAEEERMIEEIFLRVQEDFAPFTVNVTTVAPNNASQVIHVAIGGTGAFTYGPLRRNYLFTEAAFGLRGAFTQFPNNPVFVFPQQLQQITGENVAREVSKAVGMHLGLSELQTAVSGPATGNRPIMQDPGVGELRNTWNFGTTQFGAQADIAVLTGLGAFNNPGFRPRADDLPAGTFAQPQNVLQALPQAPSVPIPVSSGLIGVAAVTGQIDSDLHAITMQFLPTGTAQLSLNVVGLDLSAHTFQGGWFDTSLNPGSNLDIVARLYNSAGQLVVTSNLSTSISATINYEIPANSIPSNRIETYFLEVTTTSEYGSLGEYTISGTLQEVLGAPEILAPLTTVDTVVPSFSWTPSLQATSYVLEVSNATTGALVFSKTTTFTQYAVNPEDNSVRPRPITGLPQGNYTVRVKAVRGAGGVNNESTWSTPVTFTVDVPLPSKPSIVSPKTITGEAFPTFEWTKGPYDRGFTLQVFKKGTTTRVIFKTNLAENKYVHFTPLPNGAYTFNVRAFNAANEAGAISESVSFNLNSPVPVAPKLTAPAATTTSIRPRIVWTAVNGAAFYELKVDNLSTGVADYIRRSGLPRTQTFFDPPVMTQGNYRAYVRGISGDGKAGPWSPAHTFTLNLLPPAAPVVTGPRGLNDSPTIQTTNPTFRWTVPFRGVKYDLLVNNLTTKTAGVIRQNGLKTTSFTALTNLAQGSYRVWVRAYNLANEVGDWSAPFDFNIDEPTPATPTMTSPVVNSLGYVENANPTFNWTVGTPAAPLYDFTLYNVTLGKIAFTVRDLTTASYTVPTAQRLSEHIYIARVRAKNVSGDASQWSTPYQFRVNIPDPTTPVIIAPGDTITDTTPTFSWRHSGASFTYEILIRDLLRNEDISVQVRTFSLDPGGATASYTLPAANALKTGTYRFWVRAFNSLGQASGWSTSRTFVITAQLDENRNDRRGENSEALVEPQIAAILSGRSSAPVDGNADMLPPEEISSEEYVAVAQPVAHNRMTVVPEVSGDESLIDAFMHRIADPSTDTDFTFLRS